VKSLLSGEKILKLSRACEGDVFLFARTIEIEVARAFAELSPTAGQLHDHANAIEEGLG
jgi:hypothetical protein